jgi:cell division protein FtsQ
VPADALPAVTRLRRLAPIASWRIARFVPSRRSVLIGAGVVAIAAGSYAIARETPLFAIHQVDVTGGSNVIDAQVARTLEPLVGKSLVGLNGAEVLQRTEALSTVVSASYDRAFPNTLRVKIVPERPITVLRDGGAAWVVSARGRVIRPVDAHGAPTLPRMWIAGRAVRVGETLPPAFGGALTRVLTAAGSFRSRIVTASLKGGSLVFHLRSGLELALGGPSDIPLKVAVAERVLQQLPWGTRSVDVSVPSRPVASSLSLSS